MITSNDDGKYWCHLFAEVVILKGAHRLVLIRNSHGIQVNTIPDCFEVTTAQQKVHFLFLLLLPLVDVTVHLVELAMQAANNSYVHFLN